MPRLLPCLSRAALSIGVLLALTITSPAQADEPTPAETLLAQLEKAEKDADAEAWPKALGEVPDVFAKASKKERKKLARAVGRALENRTPVLMKVALAVVVKLDDPDLAFTQALSRAWPKLDAKHPGTWDVQILTATWTLRPDKAIDPLLLLMKKAKAPEVAAGALRVLGAYERSRRRVYVLEELAKIVVANAPGKSRKGSSGTPRFWAMASQLQAALNELTGQTYTLEQWGPAWKAGKKRPAQLFVRPLPKRVRVR